MRTLLRSPLRRKVALSILVTSAVALALASAAHLIYEYSTTRTRLSARLGALAGVVGEHCTAPLVFNDHRAAERSLAGLVADYRILAGAVYAPDGSLFATFARSGSEGLLPRHVPDPGHPFSPRVMAALHPIVSEGRLVGTILLLADLSNLREQIGEFSAIGAGVIAIALLVASLLAYRLQRLIVDPVDRLATAARDVTESGDYRVRVTAAGNDELGRMARSFNAMLDQIERRDTALRRSEERYALAVQGARDGIWDWDLGSGEIVCSPRWFEMLGYRPGEIQLSLDKWFSLIYPDDVAEVRAALDAHLAGTSPAFEIEYRMRHRNGGWLWVHSRGVAYRDPSGRPVRMAGSLADVTARKGRDALTGLPNRVLMIDRLESAMQRHARRGAQWALLAVELDRLDLVNQTLGRIAGRDLLLVAADRLMSAVGPHDKLARLEGGMFAILLEEIGSFDEVTRHAAAIHTALAQPFTVAGQVVFTTAAIGIALSQTGYHNVEDVLRDAHAAAGRARERGESRTEVFDERIRAQNLGRLDLENELRRAVELGRLELHYQPIVTLPGQRLAGFEALVRWPRSGGTLTPPAEFIGLAEETGIIVPLGHWVLREACRQLGEWKRQGVAGDDLSISVNVSARQLERSELVGEVESALRDCDLPADRLKLEITESAFVQLQGPTRSVLDGLDRLGVGIWLDDFGTGYSNLAYLHRFPIEVMKIDRSFVHRLAHGTEHREIAGTLIELARSLGMKSVAEGVESPHQMRYLEDLRCDLIQGHAISLPLTAEAVPAMLRHVSA